MKMKKILIFGFAIHLFAGLVAAEVKKSVLRVVVKVNGPRAFDDGDKPVIWVLQRSTSKGDFRGDSKNNKISLEEVSLSLPDSSLDTHVYQAEGYLPFRQIDSSEPVTVRVYVSMGRGPSKRTKIADLTVGNPKPYRQPRRNGEDTGTTLKFDIDLLDQGGGPRPSESPTPLFTSTTDR